MKKNENMRKIRMLFCLFMFVLFFMSLHNVDNVVNALNAGNCLGAKVTENSLFLANADLIFMYKVSMLMLIALFLVFMVMEVIR